MALSAGQILHDRYRIDALLGKGGMGAVYKAWDNSLSIPVAVKENLDTNPEAQKQFMREAHILAALSHPNLPRVIDYFLIPDQGQYLVMDYVDGEDLASMLSRLGVLPEPQVLNWVAQICDALAYLHSQPSPIIHRDIKPANIKIRPDGRAMLVDFGIAKIVDKSGATTLGARALTPGYSPPEQYAGSGTDARSDIYALGATLYHLLSGRRPMESVERLSNPAGMPPLRSINGHVSPWTEQAVERAIEVNTQRRFQSVAELKAALAGAAPTPSETIYTPTAPRPVATAPGPISQPVNRPASRPPTCPHLPWRAVPGEPQVLGERAAYEASSYSRAATPKAKPKFNLAIGIIGVAGVGLLGIAIVGVLLLNGILNPPATPTVTPAGPTAAPVVAATDGLANGPLETIPPAPTRNGPAFPTNTPLTSPTNTPQAALAATIGENLIRNPSFEDNPPIFEPYWTVEVRNSDLAAYWSTERAMSGEHSLFLSSSTANGVDWPGWFASLPYTPGFKYNFDVMYFSPDGARAVISIDFLDKKGKWVFRKSSDCTPSKAQTIWRPLRLTIDAAAVPEGVATMRLGLRQCLENSTPGARTTLYYDDVSLAPAKP